MNEEDANARPTEVDFAQLARPRAPGEPMTDKDFVAAKRVVDAYWPKFRTPRTLPEKWQ
ncbi:hypothetical protein ATK36_3376 [Amycolatopsis sulphurea]|uniref:Uncharacterized protein n=1 Tax=Amycolatopsis sulphurea TaxID=76022 RepID=A0A2A9FD09_9PSEU|nr:hypothetical protein [Amycolatopsis sulphurea]PFG48295.1 hypothetical protein ATK36_3376 [Amycolatopsis sulphurea]